MTAADLTIDRIYKTYQGTAAPALNDVSLAVEQGEFLSLLGPSGCGKTTLLRIIGGFVAPSSGRVSVRGNDVTALPPQRRPTAMVFQNYALFPHMTAADNVAFGLNVRRIPSAEIANRVAKVLKTVGLASLGDRYPHQLSGGQQQRVALGRAFAVEPPILLMDEPLGALDAKLREEMQFELRSIQRRLGITTVYVTHDQEEAFNMSDHVAVMSQGRILQLGAPDDIYRRPTSAFVADFVGKSTLIRAVVNADGRTVTTAGGQTLIADIPASIKVNVAAILMLRPEDVSIRESPDADNRVDGIIEHRRFTGGAHLYYVRSGNQSLFLAEDRQDVVLSVGDRVRVCWRSDRSTLLPDDSPKVDA